MLLKLLLLNYRTSSGNAHVHLGNLFNLDPNFFSFITSTQCKATLLTFYEKPFLFLKHFFNLSTPIAILIFLWHYIKSIILLFLLCGASFSSFFLSRLAQTCSVEYNFCTAFYYNRDANYFNFYKLESIL